MKFALSSKAKKADLLLLTLFKEEKLSNKMKSLLGATLTKAVEARIKAKDFTGESGQSLSLYPEKGDFEKIVLLGRGKTESDMPSPLEELGGTLARLSKGKKSVAILVDSKELEPLAYGFALGSYEYTRYKKVDKKAPKLGSLTFLTDENKENKAFLSKLNTFNNASTLVRDLVNAPAGDMNTKDMEDAARKLAKSHKLKITVFDHKKLKKLGCGGHIGVGQGAEVPPRMIFLEYKYKTKNKQPNIAFVGKGIVFDTGGLNLKPTNYIETMKQDMAGAATVLGTMQAIAESKIPGYFLAVLCCAENAVSDRSIRPGDVITAYNGKTIEVTNTDAEGRLVLSDGLAYTEKHYKPQAMFNIATLTGAVSIALGNHITGIMGNDEKLLNEVLQASEAVHEHTWRLPLDGVFSEAMKGSFTDLVNSTNAVRAGTSTAGAFLKNFVDKTPWTHFDIGGTAWKDKPTPTTKYGATAAMLRTFIEMAERRAG